MVEPARQLLNPDAPAPLYRQLAELLRGRILRGDYAPGEKISSEPRLVEEFGIGRPTVRQAIELLTRQGYLERRRGSGTYLRPERGRVDLLALAGTSAAFATGGVPVIQEILRPIDQVEPGSPAALSIAGDALDPFDGQAMFLLTRRTSIAATHAKAGAKQTHAVLVEDFALRAQLFPGMLGMDLAGRSIAQIVEDEFHLRPDHALQSFRVRSGCPRLTQLLDLADDQALLEVHRDLYLQNKTLIVHARLYCRTDRFEFSQRLDAPCDPIRASP